MIYYGKREPGGLTASAPGDTLVFPFDTFNDSGASIALSGLAVTDIEVFKNGDPTTRATDSGYSLISDTGMVGNRVGLYRCSVQLFNTADDTGHYESGASYQVAIDAVTVDARTIRKWIGAFDIGRLPVNVVALSDTGVNERLARIQSDVDTGFRTHINDLDTGLHDTLSDYDTGMRALIGFLDTGLRAMIDDLDTGLHAHVTDVDTGVVEKTLQGVRDRIFNADMAEMTDSGTASRRTPLQALRALRNRVELDTGTFTVMKEDDTTASFTGTLETDTGAKPIKTINPA